MEEKGLTDHDIFLLRRFCADELAAYARPMRDFWEHAASYAERGPGEHELIDSQFTGAVGYRVCRRKAKSGTVRGLASYPFVRVRSLNVVPADGSARYMLRKALAEPLIIGEFHCVLDSDKRVAFLTEDAYAATLSEKCAEACVVLGREEAYAMLAGRMLERTRGKLIRAFDMDEGEWIV